MEDMFEILQAIQASVWDFPIKTSFSVNKYYITTPNISRENIKISRERSPGISLEFIP